MVRIIFKRFHGQKKLYIRKYVSNIDQWSGRQTITLFANYDILNIDYYYVHMDMSGQDI